MCLILRCFHVARIKYIRHFNVDDMSSPVVVLLYFTFISQGENTAESRIPIECSLNIISFISCQTCWRVISELLPSRGGVKVMLPKGVARV